MVYKGIRISTAKKPYIFVIFQRRSGPHVPPPLDPHMGMQLVFKILENLKHSKSWMHGKIYKLKKLVAVYKKYKFK